MTSVDTKVNMMKPALLPKDADVLVPMDAPDISPYSLKLSDDPYPPALMTGLSVL